MDGDARVGELVVATGSNDEMEEEMGADGAGDGDGDGDGDDYGETMRAGGRGSRPTFLALAHTQHSHTNNGLASHCSSLVRQRQSPPTMAG